jgi:hypothetical protein
MSDNIYTQVVALGIEHSNHESDLYIPVNEQTRELVKNYKFASNVTTFKSNIDGKPWYDIPFAFTPYWDAKSSR